MNVVILVRLEINILPIINNSVIDKTPFVKNNITVLLIVVEMAALQRAALESQTDKLI